MKGPPHVAAVAIAIVTLLAAAARQELTADEVQYRETLAKDRGRNAALAGEPVTAQRNVETQSNKTTNEVVQLKAAVSAAVSELQRERERAGALASELAKVRREAEAAAMARSQKGDDAVQQKQMAEGTIADLQHLLQLEKERTAALTQQIKTARQAMTVEQQPRLLDETPLRAAITAGEPAGTRRAIETQTAPSQPAFDEAVQQKQRVEGAVADLQKLLQQEQQKSAALTQEVGAARQAMSANAEQQRRALGEAEARAAALAIELAGTRRVIETQAVLSQKPVGEAVQQKQAAKAEAMVRDSARQAASVPRPTDESVGRPADSVVVKTEPLYAAEAQGSAESAKLIARAGVLLDQGNIGAARIVLERAVESDNAQASFMLAETYDPAILSTWGTYGTRGEAAKAREYYAKAHTGGIREAKDRLDALHE